MRLVYLALGWTAGLIFAAQFAALVPLFWLLLAGFTTTLVSLAWRTHWHWPALALLAFALAGYRFGFVPQTSAVAQFNDIGGVTIEGIITSEPDIRDDRVQIQVAAQQILLGDGEFLTSGLVLVNAPRRSDVRYGDRVRASGRLATPAEFDTFSYADFLARSGVFSVMQNAVVEVRSSGEGSPITARLLGLKADTQQRIAQALPDPQAGLLAGILLGNERGIDPQLRDAFSKVGASHIIAISGFNMALISGMVMGLLGQITARRWLSIVLGILIIAIYTFFVGANPAVVRAAIMSSLLVIAPLFKRRTYVPASLAFAALLLSLHNPLVLWRVSFQLSFFAVLGLALFTRPLQRAFDALLHRVFSAGLARTIAAFLNEPLIVTLAALSLTLPLTIVYFQRLSLVALLVNVLIVPAQAALLMIGAVAVLVSAGSPALAQVLFWVDMLLLSWSIGVVRLFAALPFADTAFVLDTRLVLLLFLAVIGGAMLRATRPPRALRFAAYLRRRAILNVTLLAGLALALLLAASFLSRPDGLLHLWWLDVGHSNAVLVQTPQGAHLLVDGGRFPSRLLTAIGDRLPFYDRRLEVLAITQPDEFDTAALPAVLERYAAGVILSNGQPNQSDSFAALQAAIAPFDRVEARTGYTIAFADGVLLEVLHPTQKPQLADNLDDVALVLRLRYGEVSFLFNGDLNHDGQVALLENGQWPVATVMTLPQHGTKRSLSEDFLMAVQPQLVIYQGDVANFRKDPDSDVLAMLAEIPLLRTDEQGALHLWTDGRTLWWQSEN